MTSGPSPPLDMGKLALGAIKTFLATLGISLKVAKTEMGKALTFLGLEGSAHQPATGMCQSLTLPLEKSKKLDNYDWQDFGSRRRESRPTRITNRALVVPTDINIWPIWPTDAIPTNNKVTHGQLCPPPLLSDRETRILQWWEIAISNLQPRLVRDRSGRPDVIIFTGAATKAGIIAAVTIIRSDFLTDQTVRELRKMTTVSYWRTLFGRANLIYGLEMLAILAFLYAKMTTSEIKT